MLRLLASKLEDLDDLKLPKKLKDLYLSAGKARDIQLQILRINEIVKEECKPSEYLLNLQAEEEKWLTDLKNALEEHGNPLSPFARRGDIA